MLGAMVLSNISFGVHFHSSPLAALMLSYSNTLIFSPFFWLENLFARKPHFNRFFVDVLYFPWRMGQTRSLVNKLSRRHAKKTRTQTIKSVKNF